MFKIFKGITKSEASFYITSCVIVLGCLPHYFLRPTNGYYDVIVNATIFLFPFYILWWVFMSIGILLNNESHYKQLLWIAFLITFVNIFFVFFWALAAMQ